jgi:serine/threonine protein kinase
MSLIFLIVAYALMRAAPTLVSSLWRGDCATYVACSPAPMTKTRAIISQPDMLSAATRVGPYEILALLGEGGMGEVYRAKDTVLGREVAVKVLPPAFSADPERVARFQREAQALAALSHPNIASIYGFEQSGAIRALVMELVEGPTLADRIAKGRLPVEEALTIARQIAEALESAHEKGIVHRDLKPANVKIRPDGQVKVLDFGLAAMTQAARPMSSDPANSPTLTINATREGVIMGTAAYMSPEQARGTAVDKRADIWSFGVVLFELLTGRVTFAGDTISDTLASVLKTDPDWSALPAETPTTIRKLLRRCLERDRKRRLHDIADARLEIDEALTSPTEAPTTQKTTPWPWAVAALAALAAVAVSLIHFREEPPRPSLTTFSLPAPENTTGMENGSLSPDGRRIAFTAVPKGSSVSMLYMRSLDTLAPRALKGTEGARGTAIWSPDGRFVAFQTGGKLKKIDVNGGPPQILCDADSGGGVGAWSSEGVILFVLTSGGLYRVPAVGGTATLASKPDPSRKETRHTYPRFLPGGRRYLFVAGSDQPGASTLNAASLDSPQRTVIMPVESNVLFAPIESGGRYGYLLFVRDGTLLGQPFDSERLQTTGDAFPVTENISADPTSISGSVIRQYRFSASDSVLIYWTGSQGKDQLAWFDRSGKQLETVGPASQLNGIALAPDGQHIAAAMGDGPNAALWLLDGTRGTSSRLTFEGAQNRGPVFSPDGSRVAFCSTRTGGVAIYKKSSNGTGAEEKLLEIQGNGFLSDWSRDGRYLTYSSLGAIWFLLLESDHKPFPLQKTTARESFSHFSPDGKWVAYQSDESGKLQVYVQPFPPGAGASGKWQISVDGGVGGRWRGDGKELFYLAGGKLMAVEVSAVGGTFHAGIPKMLFDPRITSQFSWNNYAPSADGRRFLIPVAAEQEAALPMTVVLNWMAGLKRSTTQ